MGKRRKKSDAPGEDMFDTPPANDDATEEHDEVQAPAGEPEENGDSVVDNGDGASADSMSSANLYLRKLMEKNYIEYASYVIKERAIPDVDDGLKPVQRRILWSLFRMDDGKFHKVANVIGHTMQYHPHGDASIGDALVVLANKEYFLERQGNFGNVLTGDAASAARYIECRLTELAKEVLFNSDITEFTDSYDGRNKEPVRLPSKIPSMLLLGADGIAVGMATHILPHNFCELLEAQMAVLNNEPFEVYPDFIHGGTMDVSEYNEGNGKITCRAKIDIDGRRLIIRDIPAGTTTESLIASIEKAAEKNKIKIASIHDYTAEKVEIEITPMRGYDPEKALNALYAYTDCSMSISVNMMVICDNKPVQMSVSEVLKRNTEKLLEYLRRELEIEQAKLQEKFHEKTLAQIFIENRIYKKIENCKTYELILSEVRKGLAPFKNMLRREITDDDIEKLLAIQIRRISLFDMNKNQEELDNILKSLDEVQKHLKRLKPYAIKHLKQILEKYGKFFPRRTEIEKLDKIDRKAVALNNVKVGWDRANGYIGTNVKSDDQVTCTEYDHLLCVERNGKYKVVNIPEKVYIGRLYDFRKYDKETEFGVVYSDNKTDKVFAKRCAIDKFITDREYRICPEGCKLELITPRPNSIYECQIDHRINDKKAFELNLMDTPLRSARARGALISSKKLLKITFSRLADSAENPGDGGDTSGGEDDNEPDLLSSAVQSPDEAPEKNIEKNEDDKKKDPKSERPASKKKSDGNGDDDDWGITQPELGF